MNKIVPKVFFPGDIKSFLTYVFLIWLLLVNIYMEFDNEKNTF